MMFDQQKYVNSYLKNNYKTVKIRIRKDDSELISKLEEVDSVNKYVLDLIRKDVRSNRAYNFINSKVVIDFPLTHTMEDLVRRAEEADLANDYGLYMNMADAIDSQGKNEATRHIITDGQWMKLVMRHPI